MDAAILGLVLHSTAVIFAERKKQTVSELIEAIALAHGPVELSLSPAKLLALERSMFTTRDFKTHPRRAG